MYQRCPVCLLLCSFYNLQASSVLREMFCTTRRSAVICVWESKIHSDAEKTSLRLFWLEDRWIFTVITKTCSYCTCCGLPYKVWRSVWDGNVSVLWRCDITSGCCGLYSEHDAVVWLELRQVHQHRGVNVFIDHFKAESAEQEHSTYILSKTEQFHVWKHFQKLV